MADKGELYLRTMALIAMSAATVALVLLSVVLVINMPRLAGVCW